MKTEPEIPIPTISQTGMRPIEHTVNDQRPKIIFHNLEYDFDS